MRSLGNLGFDYEKVLFSALSSFYKTLQKGIPFSSYGRHFVRGACLVFFLRGGAVWFSMETNKISEVNGNEMTKMRKRRCTNRKGRSECVVAAAFFSLH